MRLWTIVHGSWRQRLQLVAEDLPAWVWLAIGFALLVGFSWLVSPVSWGGL